MTTAAASSHTRELSITTLDCDVNPNFIFPAAPRADRPRSTCFNFPPSSTWANGNNDTLQPVIPRRGSLPLDAALKATESDSLQPPPARPRGRTFIDGTAPTVLNASVRLGSSTTRTNQHSREASELLQAPNLDPMTSEQLPLSPANKVVPPPPGGARPRRGHAHRRSGAISSHDVWSLMKESPPPLPNQSKTEMAPPASGVKPGHSPRMSVSVPLSPGRSLPLAPSSDAHVTPSPLPSPEIIVASCDEPVKSTHRVTFVEQAKVIDGDNTATADIPALSPPLSPPESERTPSPSRRNRTRSNSQTMTQPTAALRAQSDRPSTAGAVLASPPEAPPVPPLSTLPLPLPDSPTLRRPASANLLGEFSDSAKESKKKKSHKKSKSDCALPRKSTVNILGSSDKENEPPEGGKKKRKGKKKVKNWAGNLKGKLRHPKGHNKKSKRAPTPPVQTSEELPGEHEWVATSWNDSYVIMPLDSSPVLGAQGIDAIGAPGSPIIDLDAALGPFKTPLANPGPADRRRRMHSSGGRGTGGYVYHRRSESMPEMQMFALDERDRVMEDVFEEEDEDEDDSSEDSSDDDSEDGESRSSSEQEPPKVTIQPAPSFDKSDSDKSTIRDKNRLSCATITQESNFTESASSLATDTPSRRSSLHRKALAEIDTSRPASPSHPDDSLLRQPVDSPLTYHTASSMMGTPIEPEFPADAQSLEPFDPYRDYLGEPGPEMRMSVDDIPSLTSSSSTMTMSAAYSGMPSTPSSSDLGPQLVVPGCEASDASIKGSQKSKKGKVMLFTTNPYGTLFVGFSSGVESGEWGRFGELELKLLKKERTGKRKKERDVNDPL
ncbi:hypothetical protein EX30DRAFT_348397 [Ascodesmis nigricans]|uniref:Uncharacterized protein n=1 Tax=Ascodesmis nigricans TaxID=341454 RepID=A0A4V3SIV1_9PEZI|nr:hypothetical protein EX30DRAFT_348397 [Ascodesmis nigricans]